MPGRIISKIILLIAFMILTQSLSNAAEERRRDQFGKDFGYYFYPIIGEIPGLGSAGGGGFSVLNLAGNDADITGYFIEGDFRAKGLALLDYHLIDKRLIFDVGYNDYFVAPIVHNRGIDSDPDDVIHPKAEGQYLLGQLTLTFDERRYEIYSRLMSGRERLHEVLDKDGDAFEGIDKDWHSINSLTIGGSADLTDDRLDPRKGTRFEFALKLPSESDDDESEFFVTDYNLTQYIPFRRWDTLALNLFYSRAYVTRKGETDFATLQQTSGLDCGRYPAGVEREECIATETQLLNNMIGHNRYGTATSLGGTQRLRSYNNFRFFASQAISYGIEYRWNLTDERTPFDIFIAKGIRTGIQLAAFWEGGSVADHGDELFETMRNSYGLGFRLILSGVVIRADIANGDEGVQSQIFITYPWSMFSVDNPG